ncbi:MAG: ATP-binding protein [bacterium]
MAKKTSRENLSPEHEESSRPGNESKNDFPGGEDKHTSGLMAEVVVSMSVLMLGAIVLITVMVSILHTVWPPDYFRRYGVFIIIPYILIFAVTVAFFGWRVLNKQVIKPLNSLLAATEKVGRGEFDHRVEVSRNREMERLARAFNHMTGRLAENRRELQDNIAELQRVNENLEQTRWELLASEKLASIGRLAAGVAHEIGNPLASINGYMQILLRRDYLDDNDREILDRVLAEVRRMDGIINELLDYSRPQEQEAARVDLNELLDSSLTLVSAQKGFDRIKLSVEKGDIPEVKANRNSIQQLIMNLVMNAVHAMAEGGELGLSTRRRENNGRPGVELSVSDTGPGIARENLERVFDPFFTTKEPGEGTGLGLSICMRIAEDNRARLWVESSPGEGAVFRVWFPAPAG